MEMRKENLLHYFLERLFVIELKTTNLTTTKTGII